MKIKNYLSQFVFQSVCLTTILSPCLGQVISDETVGTRVVTSNNSYDIYDGTIINQNLLHSFQDFWVPNSAIAVFKNPTGINNIISRITGNSVSTIDGIIQLDNNANLILLNPNGIIFGRNARLDFDGSFLGTTATQLNFADSSYFGVLDQTQLPSQLSSNPIGLLFGDRAESIINQASAILKPGFNQNFSLIGGDIKITNSRLIAQGGIVNLGSVGPNSVVGLTEVGNKLSFDYANSSLEKNISINNNSLIDLSGGGSIFSNGNNITLQDSSIRNNVLGSEIGGTTSFTSNTLSLLGNILIRTFTGIVSNVSSNASGDGGSIIIDTNKLIIQDGGLISIGTSSSGNGGNLIVNASDSVEILGSGRGNPSIISSSTDPNTNGKGGELTINTNNLVVQNGGTIAARTLGNGDGGIININASNSINLTGSVRVGDQDYPSQILASSGVLQRPDIKTKGDGGSLIINTDQLNISDKGLISVSSFGLGNAGNILINSGSLNLANAGQITAESASGGGGNIDLNLSEYLFLKNGGDFPLISTTAGTIGGAGNGGDITINSPFVVALERENSDISANAFEGTGGNININATGIYGIQFRNEATELSDITASSQFGQSGIVEIDSPDVDVSQGLIDLPRNFIDTSSLIAQNACDQGNSSEFVVAGKGGVPPNPAGILSSNLVMLDLNVDSFGKETYGVANWERSRGWQVASNGQVFLTATTDLENLINQGVSQYEAEDFTGAIATWERVQTIAQEQGDSVSHTIATGHIGAALMALEQWNKAHAYIQNAVTTSRDLDESKRLPILAQLMMMEGKLAFNLGRGEIAFERWQSAEQIYQQIGRSPGVVRSKFNQAQALKMLGLNLQSLKVSEEAYLASKDQADSPEKLSILMLYADNLRSAGRTKESQTYFLQSQELVKKFPNSNLIKEFNLYQGNLKFADQKDEESVSKALDFYEAILNQNGSSFIKQKALLNSLQSLNFYLSKDNIFGQQRTNIIERINGLLQQIKVDQFPLNRDGIYAKINYGNILIDLEKNSIVRNQDQLIIKLLETTLQESQYLQDDRAQVFVLSYLAQQYSQGNDDEKAKKLLLAAIYKAEYIEANDIAYRLQYQLAQLLKAEGDREGALSAYDRAYQILKSIRTDLVIVNKDLQFSFQESVEPIYREYVSLLLEGQPNQERLQQALDIMESLQLAELDNFFQDACSKSTTENINQLAADTAVLYPIILPDRLDVIALLPTGEIKHYFNPIDREELESNLRKLKLFITNNRTGRLEAYKELSEEIYTLIIKDVEPELAANRIETLAFVLDGSLRNLPMAALYDGKQYLIEKYAVAISPGLKLSEPQALPRDNLTALLGGITEARQGFTALPNVSTELDAIGAKVNGNILLNEHFDKATLEKDIRANSAPLIHLATHGEFSSNAEDTFILTWNDRINAKELEDLLASTNNKIELLVLSACKTAAGDNRAALGLAGIAVRAGASSTLATLWYVDDRATSELMINFYEQLKNPELTKAEALQAAQLQLLAQDNYEHPLYWAPFVLVGNWL